MASSKNSRKQRNLEKQSKHQILMFLSAIAAIIFILLIFGGTIIGGLGDLILKVRGTKPQAAPIKTDIRLQAPSLNDIPPATTNNTIDISGTSNYPNGIIELYINDLSYKNIAVDKNGKFSKSNVKLQNGINTIKARIVKDGNSSNFTDEKSIRLTTDAPGLEISSPNDGQEFKKADQQITVMGKTDGGDITVTVNGFRAIVQNDGNFSYYLKLKEGDNPISIEAKNAADKSTTKDLKVKYSP